MFSSRKRGREENADDTLELENAAKAMKPCSLPFRTSPTTKYVCTFSQSARARPAPLFTQTVTPADSEEENSPPLVSSNHVDLQSIQPVQLLPTNLHPFFEQPNDIEMSTTDNHSLPSPRHWTQYAFEPTPDPSPRTVTPPNHPSSEHSKDLDSSLLSGRMPTPIYGHFQQSIDSKMDVGEDLNSLTPQTQQEIEHDNYLRRRRLPTPIDEDEPMDTFSQTAAVIPRRLAISSGTHFMQASPTKTSANIFMAPPRSARLSFSMGVRADCELCRNRVPGHTNHIFRS
ncbi:hypothetical protein MMC21_007974 [Puttea exsequens]|nr:hypothetical protein [Puttea exsequens]